MSDSLDLLLGSGPAVPSTPSRRRPLQTQGQAQATASPTSGRALSRDWSATKADGYGGPSKLQSSPYPSYSTSHASPNRPSLQRPPSTSYTAASPVQSPTAFATKDNASFEQKTNKSVYEMGGWNGGMKQSEPATPTSANSANIIIPACSSVPPVNWSALRERQRRANSATASNPNSNNNQSASATSTSTPAGLSNSVPSEAKQEDNSTVIAGARIFPLRVNTQTTQQQQQISEPSSSSVRRNPFATPSASPSASPSPSTTSTPVRVPATFQCPDCGRSFKRGSLLKHQKVCKKVFATKREKFNSSKVRLQGVADDDGEEEEEEEQDDEDGEEGEQRPRTSAASKKSEESKESSSPAKPAGNWQSQSHALREAMRKAKMEKKQHAEGMNRASAMGIDMARMMH